MLKFADDNLNGEIWSLSALGGSGYYSWGIADSRVASISGSGVIRSKEKGDTLVTVRDTLNLKNENSIRVEVTIIE